MTIVGFLACCHQLVLAGLGRRAEARLEARWLRESLVYREDAFDDPLLGEARAQILTQLADTDPTLEEIQRLLAGPFRSSVHTLGLDPRWDPIRHDPRFQPLLIKYAGR